MPTFSNIPFQVINWPEVRSHCQPGLSGEATTQTCLFNDLRIRVVMYSPGYMADHWCRKGHIVHCLEGEFVSELATGDSFTLRAGMTYIVSDELSSHRSSTRNGVRLLIIDGDFLR